MFLAITFKVLWGSTQKRSEKVISNAHTIKYISSYVCILYHLVYILNSLNRILFKAVIVLLPILGLTWIFGIIAVNNETQVFAWIFAILNSLQVSNITPTM